MYRALKAFYLISSFLSYEECRKVVNVFIVVLSSHKAKIETIVKVFFKIFRQLDRDVMKMKINEESIFVCAFNMRFIENISQQTNNEDVARHNANMSCRICFCFKTSRDNLDFDIVNNDKYHDETMRQREHAEQLIEKDRKIFFRDTDIRFESSSIARLCSALNLIRSRAYDASHSEWRELRRILQSFLVIFVLNKKDSTTYLKTFQNFQYSSDWLKISSSIFYIWS